MFTKNPLALKVGFIGLGRMGSKMASNLLNNGIDLTVYDPVPEIMSDMVEDGAKSANSVTDLASQVDVIFTSLPGPLQVEEVVLGEGGIISAMRDGTVLFDLTSSSRSLALRVNEAFSKRNSVMLDSPVSGGPAGAASGDLVLWIGGDKATFDHHKPLLETFSKPHYVGPIGAGTVTKLAHNMLGYTILEAQAEAFTLAVKAGLDPLEFWEALRLGMVGKQSPLFMLTQQFLPNSYDNAAFAQKLALKDVRLASEMAEELGVPMRLSAATREDMEAVVARGEGDGDSRSFLKLQLERAGVEIEVSRKRIENAVKAAKI